MCFRIFKNYQSHYLSTLCVRARMGVEGSICVLKNHISPALAAAAAFEKTEEKEIIIIRKHYAM